MGEVLLAAVLVGAGWGPVAAAGYALWAGFLWWLR
jgi:hypothetical protein